MCVPITSPATRLRFIFGGDFGCVAPIYPFDNDPCIHSPQTDNGVSRHPLDGFSCVALNQIIGRTSLCRESTHDDVGLPSSRWRPLENFSN